MKKFRLLALILILILSLTTVLVACKNPPVVPVDPTPETPGVNLLIDGISLENANKAIIENKNYTLNMAYKKDGHSYTQNTQVSVNAIVDQLSYTKNGKTYTDITLTEKVGDKYYETIKSTAVAVVTPTSDGANIAKREVTKEYYDSKYNLIVNVYIPLTDSSNYEEKDGKYVIKATEVDKFAGRMGISVAEVKEINLTVADGKISLKAPNVAGMKDLDLGIEGVGTTKVIVADDIKAVQAETMNIHNFYKWINKGFTEIIYIKGDGTIEFSFNEKGDVLAVDRADNGDINRTILHTQENGKYYRYECGFIDSEMKAFKYETDYAEMAMMKQVGLSSAASMYEVVYNTKYYKLVGEYYEFDESKSAEALAAYRAVADKFNFVDMPIPSDGEIMTQFKCDKFKFDEVAKELIRIPMIEGVGYDVTEKTVTKNIGSVGNLKTEMFDNAILIDNPYPPQPKPDPTPEPEPDEDIISLDGLGNKLRYGNFTVDAQAKDKSQYDSMMITYDNECFQMNFENIYQGVYKQKDGLFVQYEYRFDKDNIEIDFKYATSPGYMQAEIVQFLFTYLYIMIDDVESYLVKSGNVYTVNPSKADALLNALTKAVSPEDYYINYEILMEHKFTIIEGGLIVENSYYTYTITNIGTTVLAELDQRLIDAPFTDEYTPEPEPGEDITSLNGLGNKLRYGNFTVDAHAKDDAQVVSMEITYNKESFQMSFRDVYQDMRKQNDGSFIAYEYRFGKNNIYDFKMAVPSEYVQVEYLQFMFTYLYIMIDNVESYLIKSGNVYTVNPSKVDELLNAMKQSAQQEELSEFDINSKKLLEHKFTIIEGGLIVENSYYVYTITNIGTTVLAELDQRLIDAPFTDEYTPEADEDIISLNGLGNKLRYGNFTVLAEPKYEGGVSTSISYDNESMLYGINGEYQGLQKQIDGTWTVYFYEVDKDSNIKIIEKAANEFEYFDMITSEIFAYFYVLIDDVESYLIKNGNVYTVEPAKVDDMIAAILKIYPHLEGCVSQEMILSYSFTITDSGLIIEDMYNKFTIVSIGTTVLEFDQRLINSPMVEREQSKVEEPEKPKL